MAKKRNKKLYKTVATSMMAALAIAMMFVVRFSILPNAPFLEYDMGDIPVIIATLFIGTPAGFIVLFLVSLVQSLTVSIGSSWEGFVMHMLSTGSYIIIVSLFIKHKTTAVKLISGLAVATVALTLIMIPLNLIFTPLYMNAPVEAVIELLLPAIIPFNFIKGTINSFVIMLLYSPLRAILKKSNMLLRK